MNPVSPWFLGPCGRLFRGILRLCLGGLLISGAESLCAQPAPGQPAPASNRFLLVVETSQAMKARKRGMFQAVQELLKSGMGGQIRAGDTLGVWTYNTNLYAGRFPLQRWSPADQESINARLLSFLKDQKFEKAPGFDWLLPAIGRIVEDSRLITVILVCSGDGAIQGTPFDDWINEFCRRQREKQKAAKMPFVIVLRGKAGQIVDYTLNQPPRPTQIPPLPAETQAAAPPRKAAPAAPVQVKPPAVPPLILSGKKPAPVELPKSGDANVSGPKPSGPADAAGSKASPSAPPPAAGKVELPAPVLAAATNLPSPSKPDESKPATPGKVASEPPKPKPEAISAPPQSPLPSPNAAVPPSQAASSPPPPPPRAAASVPAPPAPETVVAPTKVIPAPEKKAEPTAMPDPVREAVSAPGMTVPHAAQAPDPTNASSASPREPATDPAQTAVADPAGSFLSRKTTWIGGMFLLGAAFGFGWALRRSRATPHASLITRSLDHKKEP